MPMLAQDKHWDNGTEWKHNRPNIHCTQSAREAINVQNLNSPKLKIAVKLNNYATTSYMASMAYTIN